MRRFIVIAALLGLMLGMEALRVGDGALPGTVTLAAIGFVLLTAFAVAELVARLNLPHVTGFILTGVLLGPSIVDILSSKVVVEMGMFNTLALGFIALGAGMELDLRSVRGVMRTLLATIAVKVVFGVTLIAGAFYFAESSLHLTGLRSQEEIAIMSVVVGILSLGTSPAIAWAVMKETRAKGRMTDLVLSASILKDVVMVIGLVAAIASGRVLLGEIVSPNGSHDLLALLAQELGGSLAVGAAAGAVLVLYMRYVKAETLLFVSGAILSVAEVSRLLHTDPLLVFIAAGVFVRNVSRDEKELSQAVSMASLPVMIVFFTNAGGSLDLHQSILVLPLALGLFALRAGVYAVAGYVGGTFGKENATIRRGAWLGYLPQAGVTFGLGTLAAELLPQIGPQILTMGMAAMALNLLVGPVGLRHLLRSCGESRDESAKPLQPAVPSPETMSMMPDVDSKSVQQRLEAIAQAGDDPKLFLAVRAGFDDLNAIVKNMLATKLDPWSKSLQQSVSLVLQASDPEESRRRLRSWANQHSAVREDDRAEHCIELFRDLRAGLRRIPERIELPVRDELRKPRPSEPLRIRVRKRLATVRHFLSGNRQPSRSIPLRVLMRYGLEHRCAALAAGLFDLWCRTEADILRDLNAFSMGHNSATEADDAVAMRLASWTKRWRQDVDIAWAGALGELTEPLLLIDSPSFSGKAPRLATMEPWVRAHLERLTTHAQSWPTVREAAYGELVLGIGVTELEQKLTDSLRASLLSPATNTLEGVKRVVGTVKDRLNALVSELPDSSTAFDDAFYDRVPVELSAACDESAARNLDHITAQLRSAASVHAVAMEARACIDNLPESLLLPKGASQIHLSQSAKDLRVHRVNVRDRARDILAERLLPSIDSEISGLVSMVALTSEKIREAVEIARHALSAAVADKGADPALVRGAFERASHHLDDHLMNLDSAIASTGQSIQTTMRLAMDELLDLASGDFPSSTDLSGWIQKIVLRMHETVRPIRSRLVELRRSTTAAWSQIQDSQFSQDVRRRVAATGFDAMEIRAYVSGLSAPRDIPSDYVRLFSLEPLHEPRLFVAHKEKLRDIAATERAWLAGGPGSTLLIGAHGSGRTSLLNLYKLETSSPRLLRPDPLEWRRNIGLVPALSIELGVAPTPVAVRAALSQMPTTVLIDDLEQWFTPDRKGLTELEDFLELVVSSRDNAFWIVTAEESAASILSEAVGVEQAFSQVVRLAPLRPQELCEAIDRRHALSGRRMSFSTTALSRLAARLRRTDEKAIYFELLAHTSDGNLARAFSSYLSSLHLEPDGTIHPRLHLTFRIALPFLRTIPPEMVGALVTLCRFGPLTSHELSEMLRASSSLTNRHLSFLRASGLVEALPSYPNVLCVPKRVRPLVLQGLKELEVF